MIWIYIPIMRGKIYKEGLTPLLDYLDRSLSGGRLKGLRPFKNHNSPSPYQGEGDKGDRVQNKYLRGVG